MSSNPLLHVKPHELPSQVALAFATAGHGEHELPHEVVEVSSAQVLPQRWKPTSHEKSHEAPLQIDTAFGGVLHGAQVL